MLIARMIYLVSKIQYKRFLVSKSLVKKSIFQRKRLHHLTTSDFFNHISHMSYISNT